ncbi:efflux RND transporter periplasmic adaptor subunit [Neorhodopirellula lusitana]|uniref:efflux RND transporter periplasmic adaptor subunit n=1 Tax=Neorhodopirellula lusitana TaxID=445327 RepID=UPI00384AC017
MSESESQLDLSQLALDRSPAAQSSAAGSLRGNAGSAGKAGGGGHRSKRWITRYVIPIGILLGFLGLLGAAAGRHWMPRQSVTVMPVIIKRSAVQTEGTTLFQAPGWIEPRPTAISVAALAPGVIEELLVVEGQQVVKDEPIARLISIDAEMQVEQAQNTLAIREGELNRAIAERNAARVRLENPVHLQVQLADAQSMLAKTQTELAKIPFLTEAAQANATFALQSMQRRQAAKEAIAGRIVRESENEHAAAHAAMEELQQRAPNLEREAEALQDKVNAIKKQLRLLVEENRQLKEADAKVQSASALRDEAKLKVRQAELALSRNTISAPMSGRILRLIASPGSRVMGLNSNAGHSSSTVAEMYDPARLQVRADVRLEDVPMVTRGQPVEIETASSTEPIHGRVLQTTSSANIQKNTLEVKVELLEPPPNVSPEMLVTATFLAPAIAVSGSNKNDSPESENAPTETERMFVPQSLVQSDDTGSFAWVVDADNLAKQRRIETGGTSVDGLVEAKSGLQPTDKLIASNWQDLTDGSPVQVTGEDQSIGIER